MLGIRYGGCDCDDSKLFFPKDAGTFAIVDGRDGFVCTIMTLSVRSSHSSTLEPNPSTDPLDLDMTDILNPRYPGELILVKAPDSRARFERATLVIGRAQ